MGSRVRIMPLGDSITVGYSDENNGGYRGPLDRMLVKAGYAVDFVGSQPPGAIAGLYHEGHSGQSAAYVGDNIYAWLTANPADIVLLHIGTNDISGDSKAPAITGDIAQILDQIDRCETFSGTPITVVVAQIINRADPLEAPGVETTTLNGSIASMAATRIMGGDRLVVANFEPALSYPTDMFLDDFPVHPNAIGYAKMAKVWFDAVVPLLRNRSSP